MKMKQVNSPLLSQCFQLCPKNRHPRLPTHETTVTIPTGKSSLTTLVCLNIKKTKTWFGKQTNKNNKKN